MKAIGNRDSFLDFLRGMAIVAVVIGHSISANENVTILFHIIYSFHMPLLIFVSGYVEEQRRDKYVKKPFRMLYQRGVSLLLPYCVWCVIAHVHFEGTLLFQFDGFWEYFLGNSGGSLWFLPVMFGLKCMHVGLWQLEKVVWKKATFITDVVSFVVCEIVVVGLALLSDITYFRNMITYAIPYFFAALLLRNEWMKELIRKRLVVFLCIVAYIVAFPLFDFINPSSYTQLLRIFLSLCVIVVLLRCRGVERCIGYSSICLFGECSMGIYVLHPYLLIYERLIRATGFALIQNVAAVLLGIVVCWICTVLYSILRKSKILGRVLFGR